MSLKNLQHRNIFITGVSSGLGLALALQLVKRGCNIYGVARRQDLLERATTTLKEHVTNSSQKIELISADLSDVKCETILNDLATRVPMDILINCAGQAYADYFENTSFQIFEQLMNVNFFGMVRVTKAFLPAMKMKREGIILNISSLAGSLGMVGYSAYAPSKFAVVGFSECLRNELASFGIKVKVCLPQDIDTPQLAAENRTKPKETKIIAGNARVLRPEDAATVIVEKMFQKPFYLLLGFDGKFAFWFPRLFPRLAQWYMDFMIRKK